ncbi:MAG: hypothetical protein GEV03_19300 [Streptosporangiales bacterium]|nr:hypothetical protein [Streptosporangiales bacterium]
MTLMGPDWNGFERSVAPAVIGQEFAGGGIRERSSVAYIPSRRVRRGDAEAMLELRNTEDGRVAMLAFSSLEQLVDGCGEAQPWVAVPIDRIEEMQRLSGADLVLWNVELSSELRHPAGKEGD